MAWLPENLTNTWQQYMQRSLLQDFQVNTVQVLEAPYDERVASTIPAAHYEFPTGYRKFLNLFQELLNHKIVL